MKGTANVPGGGKKVKPEDIGAQAKLTGTEGQYVGFDKDGNAIAKEISELNGGNTGGNTGGNGSTVFYGTIGTEWTEDAATGVKYQLVAIDGVLASHDLGVLDVVMTHERTTEGYAAFVEENNQFLTYITNGDAETVDGGVKFYIYGDPNTVEIPFGLEVG